MAAGLNEGPNLVHRTRSHGPIPAGCAASAAVAGGALASSGTMDAPRRRHRAFYDAGEVGSPRAADVELAQRHARDSGEGLILDRGGHPVLIGLRWRIQPLGGQGLHLRVRVPAEPSGGALAPDQAAGRWGRNRDAVPPGVEDAPAPLLHRLAAG